MQDAGGWRKGGNTRFTIHNLCDFVIFSDSRLFLVEAKSHKGKSIPRSDLKQITREGKNMNDFVNVYDAVTPALLVEFSDINKVYLLRVDYATACLKTRASVPLRTFQEYGVEVERIIPRYKTLDIKKSLNILK